MLDNDYAVVTRMKCIRNKIHANKCLKLSDLLLDSGKLDTTYLGLSQVT